MKGLHIPPGFRAIALVVLVAAACSKDERPPTPGSPAPEEAGEGGETSAGGTNGGRGGRGGSGAGGSSGTTSGNAGESGDAGEVGNAGEAGMTSAGGSGGGTPGTGGATAGGGASGGSGGSGGNGGASVAGSAGVATGGTAGGGGLEGEGGQAGEGGAATGGTGNGGAGNAGTAGSAGNAGTAGAAGGGGSPICLQGERQICTVTSGSRGGCLETMRFCENNDWGECKAIPGEMLPGGEACNLEDDDCDGLIDEGLGDFSCGLGACRRSVTACTLGVLGVCLPGAPSTGTDDCNAVDDDCDGAVDEDCTACLKVAPTGNDAAAASSGGTSPFATVQAAIDFADANRNIATRVCVAAGPACGATATFAGPSGADLTMKSGIDVLGKYESTSYTRCTNSTTTLAPQTALGVVFGSTVTAPTELDGFTITRLAAATTAGVTSSGSGVVLSNLTIHDGPTSTNSYGVNVIGGDATVVKSRVTGGLGSGEAIGVRAVGARVALEDNCASPDATTGRCDDECGSGLQISGRNADGSGTSNAVRLDGAVGSRIERNSLCVVADTTSRPAGALATLRIAGDADRVVVRGSTIRATTAGSNARALGVAMDGCSGRSPWIVDNHAITARHWPSSGYGSEIEAIRAFGDCHPSIDHNRDVAGISNNTTVGATGRGYGVRSGLLSGVSSRSVIEANTITGAGNAFSATPLELQTVACQDGACAKVSRNEIWGRRDHALSAGFCSGSTCVHSVSALTLQGGTAFVDSNTVYGGCSFAGTTIRSLDTSARIQNNLLVGVSAIYCGSGEWMQTTSGSVFFLTLTPGANEVDVHSNRLSPDLGEAPISASVPNPTVGILRNNAIHNTSGTCWPSAFRIIENNGCFADSDYSSNPAYVQDLGTTNGAPLWDRHGTRRDALPDIGDTEH